MPYYKVTCDCCDHEFEGSAFSITDIITKECPGCGGDVCPNCEGSDWHAGCEEDGYEDIPEELVP